MGVSRREFMGKGALAAGAGALAAGCAQVEPETYAAPRAVKVAACGLACDACPLMAAGKCGGCGPAKSVAPAMVAKKNCPVLTCANMKGIDYCGTGCKKFTTCGKMIGRPYAKSFMQMIAMRLG